MKASLSLKKRFIRLNEKCLYVKLMKEKAMLKKPKISSNLKNCLEAISKPKK
jgi:hypothetical protein